MFNSLIFNLNCFFEVKIENDFEKHEINFVKLNEMSEIISINSNDIEDKFNISSENASFICYELRSICKYFVTF